MEKLKLIVDGETFTEIVDLCKLILSCKELSDRQKFDEIMHGLEMVNEALHEGEDNETD